MEMKTKTGKPITEKMLDEWADAFECGEWPEGKTTVLGRPSISTEEVKPVTFKLPASKIERIDEIAAGLGKTRSEFLRAMVDRELVRT